MKLGTLVASKGLAPITHILANIPIFSKKPFDLKLGAIPCYTKRVVAWLSGNATSGPVSTWMGDRLRAGKPCRYVASHLGKSSALFPSSSHLRQSRVSRERQVPGSRDRQM